MLEYVLQMQKAGDAGFRYFPPATEIADEGDTFVNAAFVATEASAVALPLGGVASPDMLAITNMDETNYVEVGEDDGGFVAVQRIKPGRTLMLDLTELAAPYVKANTANCLVTYAVFAAS